VRLQATTDIATGAFNRATIVEALAHRLDHREACAILICCLDRYKDLEREHGLALMNQVMRTVVQCIRSFSDVLNVGRYGTEQLLVILSVAEASQATAVAEGIRAAIANEAIMIEEDSLSVTLSGGLVVGTSRPDETPEWLLYCADLALYTARATGDQIDLFELGSSGKRAADPTAAVV